MALEGSPDADEAVLALAIPGTDPEESVNMMTWALTFDAPPAFEYETATVIADGDAPVVAVQIDADVPPCAVPPAGSVEAALPVHAHRACTVHVRPVDVTELTSVLCADDPWFVAMRQTNRALAGGVNDADVAVADPAEFHAVLTVGALRVTAPPG